MPLNDRYHFLFYRILYPFCNMVGLNRPLNIIRHKLGLYPVFMDGRCMWCGEKKCGVTKLNQLKGSDE